MKAMNSSETTKMLVAEEEKESVVDPSSKGNEDDKIGLLKPNIEDSGYQQQNVSNTLNPIF